MRVTLMVKSLAGILGVLAATACASYPPVIEREALVSSGATAAEDSTVYATFLETLNRDPRNDTLHVQELSKIFVRLPPHYDSTAPGLNAALANLSKIQVPSTSLHLPAPVRVIPGSIAIALANADVLGALGSVEGKPQGISGLWAFTPVAYSADKTDAMFSYSELCGRKCGEDVVVWLRKNAASKWEVRRTAIITIE